MPVPRRRASAVAAKVMAANSNVFCQKWRAVGVPAELCAHYIRTSSRHQSLSHLIRSSLNTPYANWIYATTRTPPALATLKNGSLLIFQKCELTSTRFFKFNYFLSHPEIATNCNKLRALLLKRFHALYSSFPPWNWPIYFFVALKLGG